MIPPGDCWYKRGMRAPFWIPLLLVSACIAPEPLHFNNFRGVSRFKPDPDFGSKAHLSNRRGRPLHAYEILKAVNVAHIEVVGRTAAAVFLGGDPITLQLSGFIVHFAGRPHILTAGHIDEPGFRIDRIFVFFQNAKGPPQEAELVVADPFVDFALLQFKNPDFEYDGPVPLLGSVETLKEGDRVYALGSPLGTSYSITEGTVSNLRYHRFLIHSATINPGNSGGPLVNEYGEIVAINVAGFRGPWAENPFVTTEPLATPIDDVITALRRIKRPGRVDHPQFEFGVRDSTQLHAVDFEQILDSPRPDREGVIVIKEGNGLKRGDIILALDGEPVMDDWSFVKKLKLEHDPGDQVRLRVYRDRKEIEVRVTLEAPE